MQTIYFLNAREIRIGLLLKLGLYNEIERISFFFFCFVLLKAIKFKNQTNNIEYFIGRGWNPPFFNRYKVTVYESFNAELFISPLFLA